MRSTVFGGESTNEIYAAEYVDRPGGEPQGRVWLFGPLERGFGPDPLMRVLEQDMPHAIRHGRNSLLAAADAIHQLLDQQPE